MGGGATRAGRWEEAAWQISLSPAAVTHPTLAGQSAGPHICGRREKLGVYGSCRFKDIYCIINCKRSHCFWPGRPPDRQE